MEIPADGAGGSTDGPRVAGDEIGLGYFVIWVGNRNVLRVIALGNLAIRYCYLLSATASQKSLSWTIKIGFPDFRESTALSTLRP